MRTQGRLTEWNDDRGFGFITPLDGSPSVFAHVSAFPRSLRRPMATDLVTYVLEYDERRRPRATSIEFMAPTHARASSGANHSSANPDSVRSAVTVSVVFFVTLAVAGFVTPVSWILMLVYLVMSAATVLAYRMDKRAAREGQWRTEERALHLMSLLGGWPGALVAQSLYRHKTRKVSFQVAYWITVVVNIGGTVLLVVATASTSSLA